MRSIFLIVALVFLACVNILPVTAAPEFDNYIFLGQL